VINSPPARAAPATRQHGPARRTAQPWCDQMPGQSAPWMDALSAPASWPATAGSAAGATVQGRRPAAPCRASRPLLARGTEVVARWDGGGDRRGVPPAGIGRRQRHTAASVTGRVPGILPVRETGVHGRQPDSRAGAVRPRRAVRPLRRCAAPGGPDRPPPPLVLRPLPVGGWRGTQPGQGTGAPAPPADPGRDGRGPGRNGLAGLRIGACPSLPSATGSAVHTRLSAAARR
jgi:hypothetical protein